MPGRLDVADRTGHRMSELAPLDQGLAAYLAARNEAEADDRLGRLLSEVAAPLVARVVRAQLPGTDGGDLEDVRSGALLRLTERLRALRGGGEGEPIASFEAYVVTTARNACRAHLRECRPEWTRLSNQIRYLLGHDPALASWRADDGRRLAGLAAWKGRPAAGRERIEKAALALDSEPAEIDLALLLRRLLLARGGPCPVPGLVAQVAELRALEEVRSVPLGPREGDEGPGLELVSPAAGPERQLADRRFLEMVWAEVADLPLGQRRALLLNLRDVHGGDLLSMLPTAGIVPGRAIAALLEVEPRELEALWERLPLEDREIGELFDLTQRQVVNLRKSGRERLARRLRRRTADPGAGR